MPSEPLADVADVHRQLTCSIHIGSKAYLMVVVSFFLCQELPACHGVCSQQVNGQLVQSVHDEWCLADGCSNIVQCQRMVTIEADAGSDSRHILPVNLKAVHPQVIADDIRYNRFAANRLLRQRLFDGNGIRDRRCRQLVHDSLTVHVLANHYRTTNCPQAVDACQRNRQCLEC